VLDKNGSFTAAAATSTCCYNTMQYNILLSQSHKDHCKGDVYKYNSKTDNCHAGQYCGTVL